MVERNHSSGAPGTASTSKRRSGGLHLLCIKMQKVAFLLATSHEVSAVVKLSLSLKKKKPNKM